MEKLIELLNKYAYGENKELYWRDAEMVDLNYEIVISKKFWFIKWLVENDKINIEKLLNIQNEYFRLQVWNDNYNSENYFVDGLLMLLAIQDEPIEFLISILK